MIIIIFLKICLIKTCLGINVQRFGIYENNVADIPNLQKFAYKNLVGINKNEKYESFLIPSSKKIEIKKSQSCGDEFFPHGIFIDPRTKSPSMYCEPHRCFKPKYIECYTNFGIDECVFDNEWISGFYRRKNDTNQWIEVECCRYKLENEGKFIKRVNITITKEYVHDIVVKNGKMDKFEYANNIQKQTLGNGEIIYSIDIYRMQCPTNDEFKTIDRHYNSQGPRQLFSGAMWTGSDELSVFEKNINGYDDDYSIGIANDGSFVDTYFASWLLPKSITYIKPIKTNVMKNCGKNLFPHGFFLDWMYLLPKLYCEPHLCLNPEKVICVKKSRISSCSKDNEWVAGFEIINKAVIVECCHYQENLVTTFVKKINITNLHAFVHDIAVQNRKLIEISFLNNIKRVRYPMEGTIFEASVFRMKCPKNNSDAAVL